jgi:hypothetical protein
MEAQEKPDVIITTPINDREKDKKVIDAIFYVCTTSEQAQERVDALKKLGLINHQIGVHQATALHYTLNRRDFHFASALIAEPETNVNIMTIHGFSPLMICLSKISELESKKKHFENNERNLQTLKENYPSLIEEYSTLLIQLIKAGADCEEIGNPRLWEQVGQTARLAAIKALTEIW